MPRRGSPYSGTYDRDRSRLLGLPCSLRLVCRGTPADSADHYPPLAAHRHRNGTGCCVLRPACLPCQREQGKRIGSARRRRLLGRAVAPVASRTW